MALTAPTTNATRCVSSPLPSIRNGVGRGGEGRGGGGAHGHSRTQRTTELESWGKKDGREWCGTQTVGIAFFLLLAQRESCDCGTLANSRDVSE
jgi:hypothetical protein